MSLRPRRSAGAIYDALDRDAGQTHGVRPQGVGTEVKLERETRDGMFWIFRAKTHSAHHGGRRGRVQASSGAARPSAGSRGAPPLGFPSRPLPRDPANPAGRDAGRRGWTPASAHEPHALPRPPRSRRREHAGRPGLKVTARAGAGVPLRKPDPARPGLVQARGSWGCRWLSKPGVGPAAGSLRSAAAREHAHRRPGGSPNQSRVTVLQATPRPTPLPSPDPAGARARVGLVRLDPPT